MIKKITLISFLVIAVSIGTVFVLGGWVGNGGHSTPPIVRGIALERQSLEQSISLVGTVHSAQSTEVHSTLQFSVESVNVQVGDVVEEGDLLALLDMSTLEMSVRQMQARLWAAQAAAGQNLTMTQNALDTLRRNVASGSDQNILSARLGVSSAELAVRAAETEVASASRNLNNARRDLREYRRYSDFYDDWDLTQSQLRSNVVALESALASAQSHLQIARENLALAQQSYEAALVLSADALSAHEDLVRAAQVSANFNDQQIAIQSLQNDLARAEIRAPVSGTVTAVIAEEGALGTGLLFVIQDTDNLIVRTNIREMDIASVSTGERVNIRADALGSADLTGTLSRIAPTSTIMAYGGNPHNAYAEFESEVSIAPGSGLKIGMNARLSITTQRSSGALALPALALATNTAGERVVFIAVQEDGGYRIEEVAVTTGMETGRLIEVSAPRLSEGVLVVENSAGMQSGMLVTPQVL